MKHKKILYLLMSAITALLIGIPSTVYANPTSPDTVNLRVELKQPDDIKPAYVKLEGVNGAPVPENTTLQVPSNCVGEFDSLPITTPGIYKYVIYQTNMDNENVDYDTSHYIVHVSCLYNKAGEITYEVIAQKDGSQDKVDVVFENKLKEKPIVDREGTAQTGDIAYSSWSVVAFMAVGLIMISLKFQK